MLFCVNLSRKIQAQHFERLSLPLWASNCEGVRASLKAAVALRGP